MQAGVTISSFPAHFGGGDIGTMQVEVRKRKRNGKASFFRAFHPSDDILGCNTGSNSSCLSSHHGHAVILVHGRTCSGRSDRSGLVSADHLFDVFDVRGHGKLGHFEGRS